MSVIDINRKAFLSLEGASASVTPLDKYDYLYTVIIDSIKTMKPLRGIFLHSGISTDM